jgi:Na+/H+ antiporter NhaD/arsenite permease-like protein
MLLIRPLLTANEGRRYRAHAVVFFILLVGNVGGALSPLGDPPLFIGFLKGVDFLWELRNLLEPTALLAGAILTIYFVTDSVLYRRDCPPPAPSTQRFAIEGAKNLLLLGAVVGAVLMSGVWRPDVEIAVLGVKLPLQNVVRDALLVALALASLALTTRAVREHNAFHWAPIVEVAKIFAGIFVTIIPVLTMLAAGRVGALGFISHFVLDATGEPRNLAVFWTRVLSAFSTTPTIWCSSTWPAATRRAVGRWHRP